MSFTIEHINDYDFLFGEDDKVRDERLKFYRFKAIINKYFEDSSLLFALVEMVNLNTDPTLDGEGETYVFSNYDENINKEILVKYSDIINRIKGSYAPISSFKDWYRKYNSFIIFGSNEVSNFNLQKKPEWKLEGDLQKLKAYKNKYGSKEDEILTEEYIKEYLHKYVTLLNEELGFSKFPYYAIIVRPISIVDEDEVHKMGNLYLHFATKVNKDRHFYCRLINDYLIVWRNEKGGSVIKKIREEAEENAQKKVNKTKEYLPDLSGTRSPTRLSKNIKDKKYSLEQVYDELFTNQKSNYDTPSEGLITGLLPYLLLEKGLITDPRYGNCADEYHNYMKIQLDFKSINSFDDEAAIQLLLKILIRREIFNLTFLLLDFTIHKAKSLLSNTSLNQPDPIIKSYDPGYNHNLNESLYQSFWTHMIIPIPKSFIGSPILNIKKKIYNSLSLVEKRHLSSAFEYADSLIPEGKKQNFYSLVFRKITDK
jgi:hypothetical protein